MRVLALLGLYALQACAWQGEAQALWQHCHHQHALACLTASQVGKPYRVDPLGEGALGRISQRPYGRLDGYDCMTYVNTMMALASMRTWSSAGFEHAMQRMRYARQPYRFEHRLHSVGADWVPYHLAQGRLQWGRGPLAHWPWRSLCRPFKRSAWYQRLPLSRVHRETDGLQALMALKQAMAHVADQRMCLPYVPAQDLLSGHALSALWRHVPSPLVFAIVRPQWRIEQRIGTPLLVSHMGFFIRDEQGRWWARHASSVAQKVVNRPLAQALTQWSAKHWGIWVAEPVRMTQGAAHA